MREIKSLREVGSAHNKISGRLANRVFQKIFIEFGVNLGFICQGLGDDVPDTYIIF